MKRHIYTLLLATALSLPAVGAFATGLSGSSNTGPAGSVGAGAVDNSTGATPETTPGFGAGPGGDTAGTTPGFGAGASGTVAGTNPAFGANTGIDTNQNTTNISPGMTPNTTAGATGTGTGATASAGQPAAGGLVGQPSTLASGPLDLQDKLRADNDQILTPQELSSADVRSLQGVLENGGYYNGSIDGLWGPKTAQALQAFQSDQNLERTGQLDARTIERLSMNTNNNAAGTGAGAGINSRTGARTNGAAGQ